MVLRRRLCFDLEETVSVRHSSSSTSRRTAKQAHFNSEDSDKNSDQGSKIEARGLYTRADELRVEYTEFLKAMKG